MKTISLKIEDSNFYEIDRILENLKKPRNRYINDAIEHYNNYQKRIILQQKLEYESHKARSQSMDVMKEFEPIDYEN